MDSLNNNNRKYQVHPDDVDARGWEIFSAGNRLGQVNDLIWDTYSMKVKYLDVVSEDASDKKKYHYLIPLDHVDFNAQHKSVNFDTNYQHFSESYPKYINEYPKDYDEKVKVYFSDDATRGFPDRFSRSAEDEVLYEKRTNRENTEITEEPPMGSQYERIKDHPGNWEEKINTLEKQKQLKEMKLLEMERDIALINEEIIKNKARLK